ncbi:MAG TPA: hypothetical protein VFH20_09690, partial [Propionibacteriaceae bacterium]|nr:hypothetical protein [Propionibacteriaceae bacterium]
MRLITPVVLGTAGLLASTAMQCLPAAAQCKPAGSIASGQNSTTGSLDCPGSPPSDPEGQDGKNTSSSGHGKPACVWVPKPDYLSSPGEPAEGQGGHWYQKFCTFGQYKTIADLQQALES